MDETIVFIDAGFLDKLALYLGNKKRIKLGLILLLILEQKKSYT